MGVEGKLREDSSDGGWLSGCVEGKMGAGVRDGGWADVGGKVGAGRGEENCMGAEAETDSDEAAINDLFGYGAAS